MEDKNVINPLEEIKTIEVKTVTGEVKQVTIKNVGTYNAFKALKKILMKLDINGIMNAMMNSGVKEGEEVTPDKVKNMNLGLIIMQVLEALDSLPEVWDEFVDVKLEELTSMADIREIMMAIWVTNEMGDILKELINTLTSFQKMK